MENQLYFVALLFCLGITLSIVVTLAASGGGNSGSGVDYTNLVTVTCAAFPCAVSPGLLKLPTSSVGAVLVLAGSQSHDSRRSSSGSPMYAIARSFDGGQWEAIQESRHVVQSNNVIKLIAGGSFEIRVYHPGAPASNKERAARLLMQGTFGPTKAAVTALAANLDNSAAALEGH